MAQESRKSELIAELDRTRRSLSANFRGLRSDLDVGQRLDAAYRRHSVACMTGAGVLGFVLARLPGRAKKPAPKRFLKSPAPESKVIKAGLLLPILKIAFNVGRPALTKWVTQLITAYAAGPRQRD